MLRPKKATLTAKQDEARALLSSPATHTMLFGGSRSGKTFLLVRQVVLRAVKAPGSRHLIARFRFNHCKSSIVADTFPKVLAMCFPGLAVKMDKTDWYATLPNGAQIWFGGLDDKERAEKILGMEFATAYLNECSQIPWASRNMVVTRLAQNVMAEVPGQPPVQLALKMFYDCNPPSKSHWSYQLFVAKRDLDTRKMLSSPDDYACMRINPADNITNLPAGYMDTLNGLSARLRARFIDGEFADATPNALFGAEDIDKWRVLDGKLPEMIRIVVGVDPSGSGDTDNAANDAIGIVVVGLGTDGNAYLLEDCTCKAGPATWGRIATQAYDRHAANCIVGEVNYGGAMVNHVIQTARPRTPYKAVTASRGKTVRAEPFSALYEQGKIRHVGYFPEMEDEMVAFSTNGYTGEGSPNRADALFWCLAELFGQIALPRPDAQPIIQPWQPLDAVIGY